MTSDLIGIENDQSQIIMDMSEAWLNNKGVRLLSVEADPISLQPRSMVFEGMSNKRMATYRFSPQPLKDLSEEQIDDKVNEIVSHITSVIQAGGEKEEE